MDDMIAWLKQEYESIFKDGSSQMTVSHGKSHKYLGMTLDYTSSRQVKVTMFNYIKEILAAFDAVDPKATGTKASAAPDELFKVNEKCEKIGTKLATAFHTLELTHCTLSNVPIQIHAQHLPSSPLDSGSLIWMTGLS